MCQQKLAANLYARLQSACEQHIQQSIRSLQYNNSNNSSDAIIENNYDNNNEKSDQKNSVYSYDYGNSDPVMFLNKVRKCWEKLCIQMLELRSIFLYLDRTYVIQNQTKVSDETL